MRYTEIHSQFRSSQNDSRFVQVNKWCVDFEGFCIIDTGFCSDVCSFFKGFNEFGTAVGITAVVKYIDPDEYVKAT